MNLKTLALAALATATLGTVAAPAHADLSTRWQTENNARVAVQTAAQNQCFEQSMQLTHQGHQVAWIDRGNTIVEFNNMGDGLCRTRTWTAGKTYDAPPATYIKGSTDNIYNDRGDECFQFQGERVCSQDMVKVEGSEVVRYTRTYSGHGDDVERKVVGSVDAPGGDKSACFVRAEYSNFYAQNQGMWKECRKERALANGLTNPIYWN